MGNAQTLDHVPPDDRLEAIIAGLLDSGQASSVAEREALLVQHPELADELRQFFADHDRMRQLCGPHDGTGAVSTQSEAAPSGSSGASGEGTWQHVSAPGRFGNYELLEEIDRGGMGVVYRACQMGLNRIVALKMILAGRLANPEAVRRFHSEARAAAALDHPGIVPIYEVGQCEGQHYFSMGLVEGPSLAARLAEGPLPPREAAQIAHGLTEAVAYAHARGVIHRDLKPANILLSRTPARHDIRSDVPVGSGAPDGYVPKITDFGLAKRADGDGGQTVAGQIMGTPSYMPPEQACGNASQVAETADIYSLGAILFAMLTGRPPFVGESQLDVLIQVIEQDAISPRELDPKIPRDLNTICLKCMAREPGRRYESAQSLADDLERFLYGEPIQAKPLGWTGRLARWARSHPALAATWMGLGVFYLMHLVCLWLLRLPGEGGAFHWTVTGLVAVWAVGAWLFQRLAVRTGLATSVLYGWTGMDVLLFTGGLAIANGPTSPIVLGYLLLIAGAGLRFRVRLVWFVTALSVLGYFTLVLDARWFRPAVQAPPYARLYFLVAVIIMAMIMHLLLRRIRTLTRTGGPER